MSPLLETERSTATVVREPFLVPRLVVIGGQTGCGKSMFLPIVGSFRGVELPAYDYAIEYLCALDFLGKIDRDAAVATIRMLADNDLYNLAMSRGVNFRLTDFTSIFRNTGTWRYLCRLIQPGDAASVERITREQPILQLTLHNALSFGRPLVEALGDRLRILEILRHPLYMVKQGFIYYERYGTDPRELSIWIHHEGEALPYFAFGWEERYVRSNLMDRVIYSMERLAALAQEIGESLGTTQKDRVLMIPFEPFVLDPWPHLRLVEAFIGAPTTSQTTRHLKRQRVPRKRIADGIPLPVYQRFGWEPSDKQLDERAELDKRRAFAAQHASAEGMKVLDRLCAEYEARYWRP